MANVFPAGTYTGLISRQQIQGTTYITLDGTGSAFTNANLSFVVIGTSSTLTPGDGMALWLSVPTGWVMAYIYDQTSNMWEPIQAWPGSPTSCGCKQDTDGYKAPAWLSPITNPPFTLPPITAGQLSPATAAITVSANSKSSTPWTCQAAYSLSVYALKPVVGAGSSFGESDLVPIPWPGTGTTNIIPQFDITTVTIVSSSASTLYWVQVAIYISFGDGNYWRVGYFQPTNNGCYQGLSNLCSKMIGKSPRVPTFGSSGFVPQTAPYSVTPFGAAYANPQTYAPGCCVAVAYPTTDSFVPPSPSQLALVSAQFYLPIPYSKTIPAPFPTANPLYCPAIPVSIGTDAVAIVELQGQPGSFELFFSYRWPMLGQLMLVVSMQYDASAKSGPLTLSQLTSNANPQTVTLVDVAEQPTYAWLYVHQDKSTYYVTGGTANQPNVPQPLAFSNATAWLKIDMGTSYNSVISQMIAQAWTTALTIYQVPQSAPPLLLSLGAFDPYGMSVGAYTTMTANQAGCQAASGGSYAMVVPMAGSLGAPFASVGRSIDAPSADCDALIQGLCVPPATNTNPLMPYADPQTCCVFNSSFQQEMPGMLGYELAACFDKNCAPPAVNAPTHWSTYVPSSVRSCGSFCGNLNTIEGNNNFDAANQTIYCAGSGGGGNNGPSKNTTIYIIAGVLILLVILGSLYLAF